MAELPPCKRQMRVRLPPPAQQLFDPAALVKWDHISLSRRSQGFDSPMRRSGPVAQSGESTDLIHRRAGVQIPPGPPAQTRGGVAQRQSSSLIRSRPLVRSRAPSPRQPLSACPSGKGLACKAGIRGFDSRRRLSRCCSSDQEERLLETQEAVGSSPASTTTRPTLLSPPFCARSSADRAPACGAGGRGFDPHRALRHDTRAWRN